MVIKIRQANLSDLPAITEIYNEAIANTTATFDTNPKTPAEQEEWFSNHGPRHPIYVAEGLEGVVGWASLSQWSDRCAYADTAEVSFYVAARSRGQGAGRQLLERLDICARELGFHTLVSRIAGESDVSIHLHRTFGFIEVGTMREVGRKFGRLLDVLIMQKIY